jgi:pimeloyl-ACP methyl ester carboxylesterase
MIEHRCLRALAGMALATAVALGGVASAAAQGAIGLFYMNGKQAPASTPGSGDIASKAAAAGIRVVVPSMPWAAGGWERISVTPEQVFDLIDGYANQLRGQGAQRIVVAGQSLGANVALAYAVARQNVAGVVMAAPGHNPLGSYSRNASIKDNIDQACQLARSGQGNQSFTGADDNQGNIIRVSTTAAVYCAWLSPRGRASMPVQAAQLPASIPVMVVIGTRDPSFGYIENNVYKPAAKNSYSRYLVVDGGDHRNTDHAASQRIVDWIKGLP